MTTMPKTADPTPDLAARAGTPLADYLAGVLRGLRPLPPMDIDLTQAYGNVLASDVVSPSPLPAFDHAAIDGYAARCEDLGDAATGQGMAVVEVYSAPKRGHGLRRAGDELPAGSVLARSGAYVTPALVSILAACGVGHVVVRPSPRVVVIATGDELVDVGRASQPGQVVDASSHALTAAAAEAGALAYRAGICDDDPEGLRGFVEEQMSRADLIITTGGTGNGPGDMVRRVLGRPESLRNSVTFTEISVYPCASLGFGVVGGAADSGGVPIVCLPGDPGSALIGFEVLARPVIQLLAGADPVFRRSVRAHLLETVSSPGGLREFRPAYVAERRGGGHTVAPLAGGPYTLSGLAEANALMVLGEKVGTATAGSTVDVLLLDRRR